VQDIEDRMKEQREGFRSFMAAALEEARAAAHIGQGSSVT
jgi:hypothetical protein